MAGVIETREVHLSGMAALLDAIAQKAEISTAGITFERPLKAASVYLASQSKTYFDRGVSPDGVAWAPLKRQRNRKRDKRAKKRGGGTGQKPLRDTGLLMVSMQGRGRGGVREIAPMHLEQGTSLHYSVFHQEGTRYIPARPFAGITDKDVEKIEMFIADDIVRQLTGGR